MTTIGRLIKLVPKNAVTKTDEKLFQSICDVALLNGVYVNALQIQIRFL
jgi:hypothetical protein